MERLRKFPDTDAYRQARGDLFCDVAEDAKYVTTIMDRDYQVSRAGCQGRTELTCALVAGQV